MSLAVIARTLDRLTEMWTLDWATRDPAIRLPIEIPRRGRADLAVLFAQLGFTCGAEIGVDEGVYSEQLCDANPSLGLLSIDPYSLRIDYDDRRRVQKDFDVLYARAQKRLHRPQVTLWRLRSLDAAQKVPGGSLDFVYIDGHHNFPNVTADLCAWIPKVRHGGIIAGHDYYKTARPTHGLHVQHVVDAFTAAYDIRPWFVLGRKRTEPGEPRDEHRSFFWVRGPIGLDTGH